MMWAEDIKLDYIYMNIFFKKSIDFAAFLRHTLECVCVCVCVTQSIKYLHFL